jgi:hypothetical protein
MKTSNLTLLWDAASIKWKLLTPWSRALLERLTVPQPVKKFCTFCETQQSNENIFSIKV